MAKYGSASTRRDFIRTVGTGAAGAVLGPLGAAGTAAQAKPDAVKGGAFKLKYAPGLGVFEASAGKKPLDQLKALAGQGFTAWFDNGLNNRPAAEQEALARESERLGLAIGPFVVSAEFGNATFVLPDKAFREALAVKLRDAVEVAQRTGCRLALLVPGRYDQRLDWDYQTANVVEHLKWCAGIVEPAGVALVLEPLNPKDHPGLFLTKMAQAYQIVKAVASPSVKILDDMYHQQITEGNIIPNLDACWDEIASFHVGDSPGRREPGTGEMNYRNIFKHIHSKGYKGVLCLEHGLSRKGLDGEKALVAAYRDADGF